MIKRFIFTISVPFLVICDSLAQPHYTFSFEHVNIPNENTFINKIYTSSNHVFTLNSHTNEIHKLGGNLNLENRYGGSGRGPGEYEKISDYSANDEILFVADDRLQKVVFYDLTTGDSKEMLQEELFNERLVSVVRSVTTDQYIFVFGKKDTNLSLFVISIEDRNLIKKISINQYFSDEVLALDFNIGKASILLNKNTIYFADQIYSGRILTIDTTDFEITQFENPNFSYRPYQLVSGNTSSGPQPDFKHMSRTNTLIGYRNTYTVGMVKLEEDLIGITYQTKKDYENTIKLDVLDTESNEISTAEIKINKGNYPKDYYSFSSGTKGTYVYPYNSNQIYQVHIQKNN